jgi:uncharacterized protein YbjT (DUF2867 family)
MDLRDRTVMILGGSGLVGHAVARRLLDAGRLERDPVLRSHILSVGIPILTRHLGIPVRGPGRADQALDP